MSTVTQSIVHGCNGGKCQFRGNNEQESTHLKWLMNEVGNLSGEFTEIRVTSAMSLACYWIIYAKTQQVRPELLRLLSQN